MTRTVMYDRDQPENNPFGIARALVYRVVRGPVADLGAVEHGVGIASDTASSFDLARFADRGPSFGLLYEGSVALDLDGTCTFELATASASRLLIDGRVVVDHPASATETSATGQATELRGIHRIPVLYAQTAPGRLGVFMTPPGCDKRELRGDNILRGSIFGRGQSGIDAQ